MTMQLPSTGKIPVKSLRKKEEEPKKSWEDLTEPIVELGHVITVEDLLEQITVAVNSARHLGKTYFWNTFNGGDDPFDDTIKEPEFEPWDKFVLNCDYAKSTKLTTKQYLGTLQSKGFEIPEIRFMNAYGIDDETDTFNPLTSLSKLDECLSSIRHAPERFKVLVIENADRIWEWTRLWMYHPEGLKAEIDGIWANAKLRYSKKKPDEPIKTNYQYGNLKMSMILLKAFSTNMHVVFTHKMRPIYNDKGKATGRYKPQRWDETGHAFIFDATIRKVVDGMKAKHVTNVSCRYQARRELGVQQFIVEDLTYHKMMEEARKVLAATIKVKSKEIKARAQLHG